jgi:hypothetical protein
MLGQDNDGEFDNARQKVSDMLAAEKRTWKAFVDSLFPASSNAWSDWHDDAASRADINPLDLVHHLLQRYVVPRGKGDRDQGVIVLPRRNPTTLSRSSVEVQRRKAARRSHG